MTAPDAPKLDCDRDEFSYEERETLLESQELTHSPRSHREKFSLVGFHPILAGTLSDFHCRYSLMSGFGCCIVCRAKIPESRLYIQQTLNPVSTNVSFYVLRLRDFYPWTREVPALFWGGHSDQRFLRLEGCVDGLLQALYA